MIRTIFLFIKQTSISHLQRVLRYSIIKELLDKKYQRKLEGVLGSNLQTPGQLISVEQFRNGVICNFERAYLEVIFLASDLARFSWKPGLSPVPYAIAKTEWPDTHVDINQVSEGWLLSGEALKILIYPTGEIQFLNADGAIIRHDLAPEYRGHSEMTAWTSRGFLKSDECVFGLGEQSGPFNLRGTTHRIWNTDPVGYHPGDDPIYMPLPVYMGLHSDGCYMLFYENSFPARFTFDPKPTQEPDTPSYASASFDMGALRYYFIPGTPSRIMERFTELTGRAKLPPLWGLGYHQCRWGYRNETDVRDVVQGFQENNLPLSAIHLDIDYMDGYRVFTIDERRFPELGVLARELGEEGIRLVAIIDPGVKKDSRYPIYQNGLENGVFSTLPEGKLATGVVWPGWAIFPDFTSPKARSWWIEQYPHLLESGIAGIWHDMNEPASFDILHGYTLPLATRHELEGRGGDHLEAHNLYALLMNRAGYEALQKHRPERRPWILSRAGWVSQQRYAWCWTGDVQTSWECLRGTVATVLGVGLSGQPYSGPDIGGFTGDPSAELYLRWFQLSAFLPFFRTHSALGTLRREPWVYGEPYTSIIRRFLHLRYQLLIYIL
jgi:alpha-glucosidase